MVAAVNARIARVAEHSFLEAPLALGGAIVVDLGCHRGGFAVEMIREYSASVYAVEPVPQLFAALPRLPGLNVEQVAMVGSSAVTVDLLLNRGSCATVDARLGEPGVEVVSVPARRLDELLAAHGLDHVDLLKVDIEGSELEVLDGTPERVLSTISQISVEYHDFVDAALAPQVAASHRRLLDLGFWSMAFSRGHQDVLYVNSSRLPMGWLDQAWINVRYRYLRGIGRVLARTRNGTDSE